LQQEPPADFATGPAIVITIGSETQKSNGVFSGATVTVEGGSARRPQWGLLLCTRLFSKLLYDRFLAGSATRSQKSGNELQSSWTANPADYTDLVFFTTISSQSPDSMSGQTLNDASQVASMSL
jgi:hypothetical protein